MQTLLNPNWAFSPLEVLPISETYNDQWIYIGPMLDLTDKLNFVSNNYDNRLYFFERFSWSIPGGIAYQIFSPVIANYMLKFGVYMLSVIGVYWALSNLFGHRTGLFAGLCLGGYAWFLRSAGWDYVDGIGIGYFSMTFASMIAAIYSQKKATWRITCFLTGVLICNLIVTNLYWVFFVPHLLIIALWLNNRKNRRPIIQSIIWSVTGICVVAFGYAFISYVIQGEWLFLKNSITVALNLVEKSKDFWHLINTNLYGAMTPHYHVIPLLILLGGIRILTSKNHTPLMPFQRMVLLQLLWLYGLLTLLHIYTQPYLIMVIYSSYLIPATFLCLGGFIAPTIESLSERRFFYSVVLIAVIVLLPFALSVAFPIFEIWQNNTIILLLCVAIIGLNVLFISKIRLILLFGSIILFGWISSNQIFVFRADRLRGQETFAIVFDAYEAIQSHYTQNNIRDVQFIQDARNSTNIPLAIPSLLYFDAYYLRAAIFIEENPDTIIISGMSSVNQVFNRVSIGQETQKTVLIIRYPDSLNKFIENYMTNNRYEIEEEVEISRYGMTFYMYFLSIMPRSLFNSHSEFLYEFDDFLGDGLTLWGFDNIELDNQETFRWTNKLTSSLTVIIPNDQFTTNETYQISFLVNTLEQDVLETISLYINGISIDLTRTPQGNKTLIEGSITSDVLNQDKLELVFHTDRLSNLAELGYQDTRHLGFALYWVKIIPLN